MIVKPAGPNARILVVDGDPENVAVVTYALAIHGYEVSTAVTGEAALRAVRVTQPDLVVIEQGLSDMSGITLLRQFRTQHITRGMGLIMLSSRSREADRIEGLSAGADDYIGKPFSPKELALRVTGVLRRLANRKVDADLVSVGPRLTIDRSQPRAWVDDEEVLLTPIEHRLLCVLADGVGRMRTRDELRETVWQHGPGRRTRTIDFHVRRLRGKLGAAGGLIESVRGLGYRLVAD